MSSQATVIAIDHGNRNIKTPNHVFPASYIESGHLPTMGNDTLVYNGKQYTLVDKRMPLKNDKTKDECYFILTLFAIGKELCSGMVSCADEERIEIELLAGLPPLHCKAMGERYKKYYNGKDGTIDFEFNNISFSVRIKNVHIYPQAFAAAVTIHDKVNMSKIINIIDIGGYTVDLLQLVDFKPDMTLCTSLYSGVNLLFQEINELSRSQGMNDIPDNVIEGVLLNDMDIILDISTERIELVRQSAARFSNELLDKISQSGMDLTETRSIFVGGGSLLLKAYIEIADVVSRPFFVDNVCANVEGYEFLYKTRKW